MLMGYMHSICTELDTVFVRDQQHVRRREGHAQQEYPKVYAIQHHSHNDPFFFDFLLFLVEVIHFGDELKFLVNTPRETERWIAR